MLLHIVAVLALAASPRLHAWLHPDEVDDDGDCAVVLFLHGGCDQAPPPCIPLATVAVCQMIDAIVAEPGRARSVFAVCGVLEHAPPAQA